MLHPRPALKHHVADVVPVAQDVEQALRDALNRANTELNKVRSEKDRYEASCDQLKKRVSDSSNTVLELRTQLQTATKEKDWYMNQHLQSKDDYEALNNNWANRYKTLQLEYDALQAKNAKLETDYASLASAYGDLSKSSQATSSTSSGASPKATTIPDRTRESRSSKKEHRDERGRSRPRDKDREKREQKAEKERLSKRFEERRPPTSNRRSSFVEGWGPGGRSTSANPLSRTYTTTGRMSQHQPTASYGSANIPRTSNPLSPTGTTGGAYSSGSSAAYDDDSYEDGNYHPYPIQR